MTRDFKQKCPSCGCECQTPEQCFTAQKNHQPVELCRVRTIDREYAERMAASYDYPSISQSHIHSLAKLALEYMQKCNGSTMRESSDLYAQNGKLLKTIDAMRLEMHVMAERSLELGKKLNALNWQPMHTAPKDGREIIVFFKQYGALVVSWDSTEDEGPKSEYAHWHVEDYKHGPYPLRGYSKGDDLAWMERPSFNSNEIEDGASNG